MSKQRSRVIFFYVTILSLLATLMYKESDDDNDDHDDDDKLRFKWNNFIFIIITMFTSSVIIIWGSFKFFIQCKTEKEVESLVCKESNLSTFLLVITGIIFILEFMIFTGSVMDEKDEHDDGKVLNCFLFGLGSIQWVV